MIPLLIILSLVIVLTDSIRLSLMGWKVRSAWIVIWMVVAYCFTMWLISLSSEEIYRYLDIRFICLFGIIESMIFISYLFYIGKGKGIISHYPGLMLVFPIIVLAFQMSRLVNGISFMAIGVIVALVTMALLTALTFFLRWLRCEKSWLYIASILSLILYILIYGIS